MSSYIYNIVLFITEKYVSTVRIVNTEITQLGGKPIWIWNTDAEKHNIIWIER